ncbi:hypothetical protein [Clostridium botulinum]|uniref:hypothetical protein n=1 Tax=Clostridium botulinum TaxID=1491 RepID=UPI0004D8E3BB|nr:hypothetical protein [Clostridium botulinum]KEH99810.1 hypothetical protein Z952_p0139 [Clostridium botulinum C/D str. BKT75002]KEI05288.1 hypothetical protein Z954_0140 [Clostridium botulinum C/D str. BKT2873]
MAGLSKPYTEGLKPEGVIKFLKYSDQNRFDKIETLVDGNIEAHGEYGGCLLYDDDGITFEIFQKSNIYAYGKPYSDSGGSTSKSIDLYIKGSDKKFILLKKNIPTKVNDWYLLCGKLEKGVYQVKPTTSYTTFTEWYIENLEAHKYLIQQNNNYYSLKSSFYELGQPSNNEEKERFYKENGIDNLNTLVEKKNSKSVNLKLDKNDIYKTVIPIDFNEITDKIEYIDEDNKKEIKYNTEEYKLLDLVKKKIGSKFQIGKWEEK